MTSKTSSQTSRRRFSLVVLLATVCLSAACGEERVAVAGNEFEANRIYDILYSRGLNVKKVVAEGEVKSWNIVVDEGWFGEDQAATAILLLNDYGLPRPPEPEIKSSDALGIVSDREEREKQKRELQQQVERQLYTLPDVIRASVIIAQPVDDVLSLRKTPPTASVSLVFKEMQAKVTREGVQSQVSGGVPNLKPENVNVTFTHQTPREIPLEELRAKSRSNKIFAVGAGIISLLILSLAAVFVISRKRRDQPPQTGELTEGDEDADILEMPERQLLNAREEK